MGGSSSKDTAKEAKVPDFVYKNKPFPDEMPAWFTSIKLRPAELAHLKQVTNQKSQKQELRYSYEQPQSKLDAESARKITLDCSKRCTYSSYDYEARGQGGQEGPTRDIETALNYAEQVCMSRCLNKFLQADIVVEKKLRGQVQTPLLFEQTLP